MLSKNCIIYTRVSSDEQVKGMSLTFQRDDCQAYAKNKGYNVIKVFEERGESAKFAERPQLMELLRYCRAKKGRVDAVIVWKLDRLSRNQMDYYFIKRVFHECGIEFHSATEPSLADGGSIEARVFETFSALQAEIDNMFRRDRAIRGMAAKIEAGIYPWHPPLGYLSAHFRRRGLKKTEPDQSDPERFDLVQRLFRACLDHGVTQSQALADLGNDWGLTALGGGRLYRQKVDHILGNIFYAGILINPWTGEEHLGRHQPMITREEFERVQVLRGKKPAKPLQVHRKENPDFPLRRTVRCADCTHGLTGSWSNGNGGRYGYYHCHRRNCARYGKGIRKAELESAFSKRLDELLPNNHAIDVFARAIRDTWHRKQEQLKKDRAREGKALRELEAQWQGLLAMKERNLLTDAEFIARKNRLNGQMVKLKDAQPAPQESLAELERYLAFVFEAISNAGEKWKDRPPERKRRFQKIVFPEGIAHAKESGLGTAKLSPIYKLFNDAGDSDAHLVHLVGARWNQIIPELKRFRELLDESDPTIH